MTEFEKKVLSGIGYFYYEKARREREVEYNKYMNMDLVENKEERENFLALEKQVNDKAIQNISSLKITNVSFDEVDNRIYITLERPGLLVGEKGYNINALMKYLEHSLSMDDLKIKLIESRIDSHLHSFLYGYLDDEGAI